MERSLFLHRLKLLQSLCSDFDENYPKSILFIPGQDGKNNKGSLSVVKYLFSGSVGASLMDDALEQRFEVLEDCVLMISQNSLAIILTNEMKKIIGGMYSQYGNVVEYLPSTEEEGDLDLLQLRKCCDFKRMVLESLKESDGVGVPVPSGYDDAQDIESWPMLQAFALDSVYCPTGFFTARFAVADITSRLDVIFRTVDGYALNRAIETQFRTVRPHMLQLINVLDTATAEQRSKLTVEDVLGPLDVLYEFGELDAASAVHVAMKPAVCFGSATNSFSAGAGRTTSGTETSRKLVGNALHMVCEGSEPSTAMRWCRTYFLRRGKAVSVTNDVMEIVESELVNDEALSYGRESKMDDEEAMHVATETLMRLEGLYVKLWFSLRYAVRKAFFENNDVFEAARQIKDFLNAVMGGGGSTASLDEEMLFFTNEYCLRASENLQIHVDCMNAFGEIVKIDDVDDMRGSCWVYVRLLVNGIALDASGREFGGVAVGDTFIFSANTVRKYQDPLFALPQSTEPAEYLPQMTDSVCVTQNVPYYRCFFGSGEEEERSTQRIIGCARRPNMLPYLRLGKHLVESLWGSVKVTVLTDHPVFPVIESDTHVFSEGFIVEKMEASCVPIVVSIGAHVERVWVVDSSECFEQASRLSLFPADFPPVDVPVGYVVVFRMRASSALTATDKREFWKKASGVLDEKSIETYNPLQRALPFMSNPMAQNHISMHDSCCEAHYIAFHVVCGTTTQTSNAMNAAAAAWRVACRVHDVPEFRGGTEPLPKSILLAYLMALDTAAYYSTGSDKAEVVNSLTAPSCETFLSVAKHYMQSNRLQTPQMGYLAMRAVHTFSNLYSLSPYEVSDKEEVEGKREPLDTAALVRATENLACEREVIFLAGHAGSAVTVLGEYFHSQFRDAMLAKKGKRAVSVGYACIDFTQLDAEQVDASIGRMLQMTSKVAGSNSMSIVTVLSVVLTAANHFAFNDFVCYLSAKLNCRVAAVLTILAPAAVWSAYPQRYCDKTFSESSYGVGQERWVASALESLGAGFCDALVVVDDGQAHAAYDCCRALFEAVNPRGQVFKLSPAALRFHDEVLEFVAMRCNTMQMVETMTSLVVPLTDCELNRQCMGFPSTAEALLNQDTIAAAVQQVRTAHVPKVTKSGLRLHRVSPKTLGIASWNLSHIVNILHALFPEAKVNTTAVEYSWTAPRFDQSVASSWDYVLKAAKAKVKAMRERDEGIRHFEDSLHFYRKEHSVAVGNVVAHAFSVHGVLYTDSVVDASDSQLLKVRTTAAHRKIFIEACKSHIVLRTIGCSESGGNDLLTLQGVWSDEEIGVVDALFRFTEQFQLKMKRRLKAADVSELEQLRIQTMECYGARNNDLPNGWWFDGQSYINFSGVRTRFRPDIQTIVERYVEDENKSIDNFNHMLSVL